MGSIESIRTLTDIVRQEVNSSGRLAIVTSAMSGVTNQLLDMAAKAEAGVPFDVQLTQMEARHQEVIRALIEVKKQNPVIMQLKIFFNELDEILQGVRAVKELSPKTRDSIASYGELCATYVVSQVLSQYFPQVRFADAREWISTDAHFGNAKVDFERTNQVIRYQFGCHPDALFCITGFIAANDKGQTTTLGRGGSDYTAAIVGAAIECEEIQVWTDVDGFMTADPRMVKKAFTLPEISYTEAMELSYFGARVIYPPTMIPAFAKRIPIVIRNTFNPEFPGTVIRENVKGNGTPVRGISSIPEVSLLNIQGSGMVGKTGFSGRLFSLLAREGINIILITQASSEHSITFAVGPAEAARAKQLIEAEFELELQTHKLDEPQVESDLAILAAVGENMSHTTGVSGKLFSALGRNGINVSAIAQGSSEYNISVVIRKKDLGKALNAVHDAFFLSRTKTLNVFYLGVGNIGKTLLSQIKDHEAYLLEHNSLRINIVAITNTRRMIVRQEGIPLDEWEEIFASASETANLEEYIKQMKLLNLPNTVFIDNSASAMVVKHYEDIFASNISIVTCNKIANSGPYEQYAALKKAVRKHGVDFFYETNVGAGLPIIKTLQDLLVSGDKIMKIEAILSGTISYIFNEFTGGRHFGDIVKEAQQNGYTEPDPRDDLSGLDFMRKMLILARDSGYKVEMDEVDIERILPDSCLHAASVEEFYKELQKEDAHFEQLKSKAAAEGKVLRYIGVLEDGKVSIRLQAIDGTHPFYALSGSDNIIAFTTTRYTNRPLVVKGPGAGAEVTAAGVFADLVKVGAR